MVQSTAQMTGTGFFEAALPYGNVTLMVKNVPATYSAKALLTELTLHCDLRFCDMLHLPIDTKRRCNVGYAFVNFTHAFAAQECATRLSGQSWTLARKRKCCEIRGAHLQGIPANLTQFVMNNDEVARFQPPYAPVVFSSGQPLNFIEAVRIYCEESVVRELRRKCGDPEARYRGAPAGRSGALSSLIRCSSDAVWLKMACVADHDLQSTSASASEEGEDQGVLSSQILSVMEQSSAESEEVESGEGAAVHASPLDDVSQAHVLQGQLRVLLRLSV
jgi:hypothetical protein